MMALYFTSHEEHTMFGMASKPARTIMYVSVLINLSYEGKADRLA